MPSHPYRSAPRRAFWSRAVTDGFDAAEVADEPPFRITADDALMSAGSCFASHVRAHVEAAGFAYTVTEGPHPLFPESAESPFYEAFSARYGNVYTARQMAQLLDRALGNFSPAEDHWIVGGEWIDPFRPALKHRARSALEFRTLTQQHLAAVRRAVEQSSVFVFTLGLTEAWSSRVDGAVFPACPGTVAGDFDHERHIFQNFSVDQVTEDLERMVRLARQINPSLKVILTVSPVPLVATATGTHVLLATTYSKSVLRVAADQTTHLLPDVAYFPAYELVTGPQAPFEAFEADRRNVAEATVARVMNAFFAAFLDPDAAKDAALRRHATHADEERARELEAAVTSLVAAQCEEEMADAQLSRARSSY